MSGYLVSLYSGGAAATNAAASLVAIAEGQGNGTQASAIDPIDALRIAERDQTTDIAQEASQPQVARDIATFTAAVKSATSVTQLLQNPTVLKVLLTANGLGDQASYTALAVKALASDPSDPSALANQLATTNSSWLATAKTYQFATKGLSIIQNPKVIDTVANGYAEVLWRQSLDATTPGLSEALAFKQDASTITSVDQILGDSTLRTVVTTALGIPEQIAIQPLEAQEQAIASRVNIADFRNPDFVSSFTDRYLLAAQQSGAAGGATLDQLAIQANGLTA